MREIRKIILSSEELQYAFECYRRITPDFLPEGKIMRCETCPDGSVAVAIEQNRGETVEQSVTICGGMDVLKPLIRFCIENNIVLPRNGLKSISVVGGAAALCISLNLHIDTSATSPMHTNHLSALTAVLPYEGEGPLLAAIKRQ